MMPGYSSTGGRMAGRGNFLMSWDTVFFLTKKGVVVSIRHELFFYRDDVEKCDKETS